MRITSLTSAAASLLIGISSLLFPTAPALAGAERPFEVQVVDQTTDRGVPLVELKTVSNVVYYTDSAGRVAIDDPALLNRRVFFYVSSQGYEFPADGFGFHGAAVDVAPGGSTRLKIKRLNIAERLYRLTGEGIYRDTVLLGKAAPIREPLLNGQVAGQDSAMVAAFAGKLYWFFGDTLRTAYPLGQYWTSGATSELPAQGGLSPADGVDLTYFTDATGFSRPMLPRIDNHPGWLEGVFVLPDGEGHPKLLSMCQEIKMLGEVVGRRLMVFNEATHTFDLLKEIPLDVPLYPLGHPFLFERDGQKWAYFGLCQPNIRCKADWQSVQDFRGYEGFTCFQPGARFDHGKTKLDRTAAGKLTWEWKPNTPPPTPKQLDELVSKGLLQTSELSFRPLDADSKRPIDLVGGSVTWNAFRRKWVMIAGEQGGKSSFLGEIWYAEADQPEGPWPKARKIITHDHYSFYNPLQHPEFEQEGGRLLYFEGTYSTTFSREGPATPRYDYNQIMYRLDLSDPRLSL